MRWIMQEKYKAFSKGIDVGSALTSGNSVH